MLKFFRKIRQKLLSENRFSKYLIYAIGEVFLVVIGILIALQINNWNEEQKNTENEAYILSEILNNLREDSDQIYTISEARELTLISVNNMLKYLNNPEESRDSLELDVKNFLKFERYFPLNNAYEMMKSTGVKLTNKQLRTAISRYYDFEQSKVAQSIHDIETVFLRIMNTENAIRSNLAYTDDMTTIKLKHLNDLDFQKELLEELISFRVNNYQSLLKINAFYELNQSLVRKIEQELATNRLKNYLG